MQRRNGYQELHGYFPRHYDTHIFFTITDTPKFYKFLFAGDLFEHFLKELLKPLYFSRKLLSSH